MTHTVSETQGGDITVTEAVSSSPSEKGDQGKKTRRRGMTEGKIILWTRSLTSPSIPTHGGNQDDMKQQKGGKGRKTPGQTTKG